MKPIEGESTYTPAAEHEAVVAEYRATETLARRVGVWIGFTVGAIAEALAPLPWWGVLVVVGFLGAVIVWLTVWDVLRMSNSRLRDSRLWLKIRRRQG